MSIKQIQVRVSNLTLGMFVSSLDRPWSQTPFPIQGFLVRSPQDIETLRSYCDYVYIDITKGRSVDGSQAVQQAPLPSGLKPSRQSVTPAVPLHRISSEASSLPPLRVRRDFYQTVTPLRSELTSAKRVFSTLRGNMTLFAKQLSKGRKVDYQSLKLSVGSMVDSVLRCPDAFTWLLRLRQHDQHSYDHSLRSALWAVQFARFIGLPKDEIETLCTATLLKDIGKMRLANELLHQHPRNPEQEQAYRRFVEYGVDMLRNTHEVEPKVIEVVKAHCERLDGSGFPEGLVGGKIPLLAQMCGIASCYDAISNPRESKHPLPASKAISAIYDMRSHQFGEELVLHFIKSVGLYPTGTLVQLTTGDLGVVVEQDPKSRLTPQVSVWLDRPGKEASVTVDLKDEAAGRQLLLAQGQVKARTVPKLAIARDLEQSSFDLDLKTISPSFITSDKKQSSGLWGVLSAGLFKRS